MLAVISAMLILFCFPQTWSVTLRIQEMFSCDTVPTELGRRDQEASPSAGKNTGVVLVPCCTWKYAPQDLSGGANISEVPRNHLLQLISYQWGSQKLLQGLYGTSKTVSWTFSRPFPFWPLLTQLIGPVWLNSWVFVYELSGCGFESSCSHLNFRFRACFEQGVPWHSGNYSVDSLWNV